MGKVIQFRARKQKPPEMSAEAQRTLDALLVTYGLAPRAESDPAPAEQPDLLSRMYCGQLKPFLEKEGR